MTKSLLKIYEWTLFCINLKSLKLKIKNLNPKDTKKEQPSYISQKQKKKKNHGHKYNIKF